MWTVQVEDQVGGFIVTDYPHPASEHDFRPEGDPDKRGHIIAECHSRDDADLIAQLLNAHGRTDVVCQHPRPGPGDKGLCEGCGVRIVERPGRGYRHLVALDEL